MIEDLRALLAQGNIVLTDEAQERLLAYHRLLLEWNAEGDPSLDIDLLISQ